jgi:hypothetical protein
MTHNHSSKPIGGSWSYLDKLYPGRGAKGQEIHHMPAHSAYKGITSIRYGEGSCIVIDKEDHKQTKSFGAGKKAQVYCQEQKRLIADGKIVAAFEMDKADLRAKFGNKYDVAISQAEEHLHKEVVPRLKSNSASNNTTKKLDTLKQNTPTSNNPSERSLKKLEHLKNSSPQSETPPYSKPDRGPSRSR